MLKTKKLLTLPALCPWPLAGDAAEEETRAKRMQERPAVNFILIIDR